MKSRTWSLLAIVVALLAVAMPATSAELLDEHLVVVSIKSRDDADAFREALDRALVLLRESSTGSLADTKIEVLREKSSTAWWASIRAWPTRTAAAPTMATKIATATG